MKKAQGAGLKRFGRGLKRLRSGAGNALRLLREGRLGAPYEASYEVALAEGIFRLRHYSGEAEEGLGASLLLVPPLMVTAEVYDISPELSVVGYLLGEGIDVWVLDFGSPEEEEGGWDRTLDDHVLAVSRSVEYIASQVGRDVHVGGYSQGGMFAYQAAGYRKGEGVASVLTFGSPVDLRRNSPVKVHDRLADRVLSAARFALKGPLEDLKGLPGTLNSYGFKLVSPRQELKHVLKMLGLLHDEEALGRLLPARRFLGGEGFIAWPGPALRKFLDDIVVNNRLMTGGFVVGDRSTSLADITCPVLYFLGEKDDFARPAAVRGIRKVVVHDEVYEVAVPAGHFGLVVGSRAMTEVWPAVVAWLSWRTGKGPKPPFAAGEKAQTASQPEAIHPFYALATDLVDGLWHRLGEVSLDVTSVIHAMRWQLPRMTKMLSLHENSRVSVSLALAEQAEVIGDVPFFFWGARAFTYAQADRWVTQVAVALVRQGVRAKHMVGVMMDNHPAYLVAVAALNRIGATAVLLPADARGALLTHLLCEGRVQSVIVDEAHRACLQEEGSLTAVWLFDPSVGPGQEQAGVHNLRAHLGEGDEEGVGEVSWHVGRAQDLAMVLFTAGRGGLPKAVRLTNRRWSLAALGAAAACALTPSDTVYCSLPLHRITGGIVAVGGALLGGARLALGREFSPEGFWEEMRRLGVTVVFYTGDMCQALLDAPRSPEEKHHALRLFAGNGLRAKAWKGLQERMGRVQILEFYGATEGNVVLVNLTGDKVGSVGRSLLAPTDVVLVRDVPEREELLRDSGGRAQVCEEGEEGVLLSRIDASHPVLAYDGYLDEAQNETSILRDVLAPGDQWLLSRDRMRRDADGDYWFVGSWNAPTQHIGSTKRTDTTEEADGTEHAEHTDKKANNAK